MRLLTVLSAALFWLLTANAQAAGLSVLEVPGHGEHGDAQRGRLVALQ